RHYEMLTGVNGGSVEGKASDHVLWTPFVDVLLDVPAGHKASVLAPEKREVIERLLDGHRPDLSLDALLPRGTVESTATWAIDSDALLRALGLDVEPLLFPAVRHDGKHDVDKPHDEAYGNRRSRHFVVLS